MRAVIQRVNRASVNINNETTAEIETGLLILLGIEEQDKQEDADWLSGKISRLRIFNDPEGIMNLSVNDVEGDVLVISQFTLHASTKKGNRPSYIKAGRPEIAIPFNQVFIDSIKKDVRGTVFTGEFGAYMKISLENDGPVTIIIDSKNKE